MTSFLKMDNRHVGYLRKPIKHLLYARIIKPRFPHHQQRQQEAEEQPKAEGVPADEESRKDVVPEDSGGIVARKSDESWKGEKEKDKLGLTSVCGSVGRADASDTRDPWFKS